MRRLMMAAAVLGMLAAGRAEAGVMVTLAADPAIDLNQLTVGQTFTVDLIFSSNISGEELRGAVGQIYGSSPFHISLTGVTNEPGSYGVDLTTPRVVNVLTFTATDAGSGNFYANFAATGDRIVTNDATYTTITSAALDYTVLPAAATPEPATLGSLALAAIGSGLYGWRRSRRRKPA